MSKVTDLSYIAKKIEEAEKLITNLKKEGMDAEVEEAENTLECLKESANKALNKKNQVGSVINFKEGYLLMWGESDEVHANLIDKDHYDRITNAMNEKTDPEWQAFVNAEQEAFSNKPLHDWFTQTNCKEPWPYNDVNILGTVSVPRA